MTKKPRPGKWKDQFDQGLRTRALAVVFAVGAAPILVVFLIARLALVGDVSSDGEDVVVVVDGPDYDQTRLRGLAPPPMESALPTDQFVAVEIFYASDRRPTGRTEPTRMFGGDRDTLHFGRAVVSIPNRHRPGNIESPAWFRFEFSEDPERHVVLRSVERLSPNRWTAQLRAGLQQTRGDILILVNGYNVDFAEAARRTAQITFDVGFDGPSILFSWPSEGTVNGYKADEADAEWAVPHFVSLLERIGAIANGADVHVIAHSMGNRIVGRAVAVLERSGVPVVNLNQVILTAPDIDAQVFEEQIAPALASRAERVTLYASSRDKALQASSRIHGYQRAGLSGGDIVVVPPVETVDASNVDTDWLAHGYFAETKTLIDDIFLLLRHGLPASDRNLRQMRKGELPYWAIR